MAQRISPGQNASDWISGQDMGLVTEHSLACYQRRCVKAYMSHDIPSRARAIIAFLGVETGYGARIKALACTFIGVGGVRP